MRTGLLATSEVSVAPAARAKAGRSPFKRPPLVGRIWWALALANARYWPTVAGRVHAQLRRWRAQADRISDPMLRKLAIEKLDNEHFNAEVAGTLATLAPRSQRERAIEAIVALEVLFDYLDGLSETLREDPLSEAIAILAPLLDAVRGASPPAGGDREQREPAAEELSSEASASRRPRACDDDGYARLLAGTVRDSVRQLPGAAAIAGVLHGAATRCIEGQAHAHALPSIGAERVREWALEKAEGRPLGWREYLAGAASSVLAMHALIAAAADPRITPQQAVQLDELYLSIAVMSTTLDSTIDLARDLHSGAPMHVGHYEDQASLAESLLTVAEDVALRAQGVPDGAHHTMTLVGVIAYYLSSPAASDPFAAAVAARLRSGLGPAIAPPLAVMKLWRIAKRAKRALGR